MIVDLLSLTDEPLPFGFAVAPDDIDLDTNGVSVAGEIAVKGELSKSAAKTDVEGSIEAPIEVDCTRCLTSIRRNLEIAFHVDFVRKEMFPESKETHLADSDLDTDVLEGDELDLTQLVREQILLNLPEQVICREECKGLCPNCGTNLNEGGCSCGDDEIDPRWSALKGLKS